MHTLLFENGPSLKSCVDRNATVWLDGVPFEMFAMDGEDAVRVNCLSGDWVGTFKPYTKEVTPDFTKKTHTISSIALKEPDYD